MAAIFGDCWQGAKVTLGSRLDVTTDVCHYHYDIIKNLFVQFYEYQSERHLLIVSLCQLLRVKCQETVEENVLLAQEKIV